MRRLALCLLGLSFAACERENFTKVHPQIAVEPGEVALGELLLGTAVTQVVNVHNSGEAALEICFDDVASLDCGEGTRLLPEGPSPFALAFEGRTPGQPWIVPAGSSRPVLVTFQPNGEGPVGATLVLASNAQNEKRTLVPLSGAAIGPRVELSGNVLDYGEVTVGDRKVLELSLTNLTAYEQPFTATIPDDGTLRFDVREAPPSIPGHTTVRVIVGYRPEVEGDHAGVLSLSYCPGCRVEVGLTGRGVRPVVNLVPSALDFGQLPEAQVALQTFRILNQGNSSLTVLGIERIEGGSAEFNAQSPMLPAVIGPGGSLEVPVTYLGTTPGEDRAQVRIRTTAWDDPNTSALENAPVIGLVATSIGADIEVVPSRLSVGATPVGAEARAPLLVQNVGNAPLTVTQIRLEEGAPAIRLEGLPALPAVVAPGAQLVATVVLTPSAPGPFAGSIAVASNDRNEGSLSIPVEGLGALPNVCVLELGRRSVTFGLVTRGRTARLPVVLSNVGGQACSLSSVHLGGAPGPLGLDAASAANRVLQPGEAHRIELSYAPTAYGSHAATLELDTGDPTTPHLSIPISGASAASQIQVVPSALDFGTVADGCGSGQRVVTVYNTGSTLVTLSSVSLDPSTPADFRLFPSTTPLSIPAGGQTQVLLDYHGQGLASDFGLLLLQTSESAVPVAVPLNGRADPSGTVVDAFQQAARPADVLFVIDNSCSMEEEQSSLGSNLSAFVSFAQAQGVDYRIAVTTTDVDPTGAQGSFVGTTRVITPNTPNRDQVFQDNVAQGIYGAVAEQGLEAAYRALSDPMINTNNAGFLRPDTMLSVVFISDEEDQSSRPRAFYENFFRNLKGDPTLVTASAIVGTTNPECVSPTGIGDYAPRYLNVARATGGVTESICSPNWSQALTNIGQAAFGIRRRFPLSSVPVVATLVVRVAGSPLPAGAYSYDAAANAVELSVAPAVGSPVEVAYSTSCLP